MSSTVNIYNLFIDSSQRQSGSNTNFKVLSPPLTLSHPMHKFKMTVKSCSIPFSFKSVSASNNTFIANGMSMMIPIGNYTMYELCNALVKVLNDTLINGLCQINYDPLSGFVSYIALQSNVILDFTSNRVLGAMFGLEASQTYTIGPILSLSPYHAFSYPVKTLFVRSSNLRMNSYEWLVNGSLSHSSDIIARVPVSSASNSWIQSNGDISSYISNQIINEINLSLTTDSSLDPIELYGISWQIHLCFEEITEENTDRHVLTSLREISNKLTPAPVISQDVEQVDPPTDLPVDSNQVEDPQPEQEVDQSENESKLQNLKIALNSLGLKAEIPKQLQPQPQQPQDPVVAQA